MFNQIGNNNTQFKQHQNAK